MSRYPWRDTSDDIAKQSGSQWETPAGAQEKADKALEQANQYTDSKNQQIDDHIQNKVIHVTQPDKDNWNSKAPSSVVIDLDNHKADKVAHLTQAEHEKLTSLKPNPNAFSQVNDVLATTQTDTITLKPGPGMQISTNPSKKELTFTVVDGSAPGPHGLTHNKGGADEIPDLVALIDDFEALTPESIGAETPTGAQDKADKAKEAANQYTDENAQTIQSNLTTHIDDKVHSAEVHGLRVQADKFQFQNDTGAWQDISGGLTPTTGNVIFKVDGVNGDDANDGLSESTAWKTIGRAIKALQSMLINHTVNVNIKSGIYDETVNVTNIFGSGYLTISGLYVSDQPWSKVKSIQIKGCVCRVRVRYFEPTTSSEVELSNNVGVELEDVLSEVSGSYGVIVYRSTCTVRRCTFSNKGTAIRSADQSTIYSVGNFGTNNTRGLEAMYGGEIMKDGSQPSGSTAESKWAGGQIWS